MTKEHKTLRLKIVVAVLFGSSPILNILPFLLQRVKFPIKPLEAIFNFMLPIVIVAFIFAIINAVLVGRKISKSQIELDQFLKIAAGIALPIFLGFTMGMLGDLMRSSARIQVNEFLASVSGNESVYIDNQISEHPFKVIEELKKIRCSPGHRSHPTDRIYIRISDIDKNIDLILRRDSAMFDEYWIFYPCYKYTTEQEIGRIYTNIFNDFKQK